MLTEVRRELAVAVRWVVRELMPVSCVFCGEPDDDLGRYVCPGCEADLVRNAPACRRCALPLAAASDVPCGVCQAQPPPFAAVVAPLVYTYPVDVAIRQFKFHRKLWYVPGFAEILVAASASLPRDIDAVLPVPLHRLRQVRRGFNQAIELAAPVAKARGVPMLRNVVRRRRTPYQSGLPAAHRRRNLKNAFAVRGRIDACHVLIVDDVLTTGSTCRQLALLLRQHGVGSVSVLALARAITD